MSENPLISVTLSYREWNALLDSIAGGSLPRYVGSREAFHAIQMQILQIVNKEQRVKHYADCHWREMVVYHLKGEKVTTPQERVLRVCLICDWSGRVVPGKIKCPDCQGPLMVSRLKGTNKICGACKWTGPTRKNAKRCPKCKRVGTLT